MFRWEVLYLSQDGACTDLLENLKGELSNATTSKPTRFSLFNTFKFKNPSLKTHLRFSNIHKGLGGGMDNIQELHDGGAVVADGGLAAGVHNELVHAARAQRRANGVHYGAAGVDVGYDLLLALGILRPLLQQEYLRLHGVSENWEVEI